MKPRLDMPRAEELTPDQAQVVAEAVAGKRGKVPAPMVAWLRNPDLARRGQVLGELLRYDTSLPPQLSELAILICARHWTAHHEWSAHKKIALEAGLAPEVIADIAARRCPGVDDPLLILVHDLASEMLRHGRIEEDLYLQGIAGLGEQGMVELVGILGYYSWVALTLNVFQIGLPEGHAPELQEAAPGSVLR